MEKFELKLINKGKSFGEYGECSTEVYKIGNYEVVRDAETYPSGRVYIGFSIYPDREMRYLPEIYYHMVGRDENGNIEKDFKIQTTAYGSLKPEEIQKVVEGYQEALEVVKVLNNLREVRNADIN